MEPQTHSEERTSKSILKSTYFLAATSIGVMLILVWFIYNRTAKSPTLNGESDLHSESVSITLSSGEEYYLNKEKSGIVLSDNAITYNDGTLINESYRRDAFLKRAKFLPGQPDFMIVNNSGNQRYQVKLPDSTKIWLNGNSSIKVPLDYLKSDNRVLQLVGEAFFNVSEINTGKTKQPFIVLTEGQMVEMYGTRFNLASYPATKITKTTVVEGNLKVTALSNKDPFVLPEMESPIHNSLLSNSYQINSAKPILLKSNQLVSLSSGIFTIDDVDVNDIIAWQSDEFDYRYISLERLMKVISAWYGVSVVFKDEYSKNQLLGGSILRSAGLKEILSTFSLVCDVKIRQVGNKIIISK